MGVFSSFCVMKVQAVLLLALLGLVSCQLALVNPAGRGFSFHDARHAPCGQSPTEVGDRIAWEQGRVYEIEVQILGAAGGGVIVDRYACVRNGDDENPIEPILPIEGALKVQIPDYDDQIYRLYTRTPSFRCTGDVTMQLVYSAENGQEFFQCQDIILTYSGAASLTMSVFAIIAIVLMVL